MWLSLEERSSPKMRTFKPKVPINLTFKKNKSCMSSRVENLTLEPPPGPRPRESPPAGQPSLLPQKPAGQFPQGCDGVGGAVYGHKHILQTLLGPWFWESLSERIYDRKFPKDAVILLNKLTFYPLEYLC